MTLFPNRKGNNQRKIFQLFIFAFFSHLDPQTTKHLCIRLILNVTLVIKCYADLSPGSPLSRSLAQTGVYM